jgi:hypothetical protein
MQMHACSTGGHTFGVTVVELAQPQHVAQALLGLRAAMVGNFSASQMQTSPLDVPGMTPQANATLVALQGVALKGEAVQVNAAVFARGLHVYQATVFGNRLDAEVAQTFFSGLKLP